MTDPRPINLPPMLPYDAPFKLVLEKYARAAIDADRAAAPTARAEDAARWQWWKPWIERRVGDLAPYEAHRKAAAPTPEAAPTEQIDVPLSCRDSHEASLKYVEGYTSGHDAGWASAVAHLRAAQPAPPEPVAQRAEPQPTAKQQYDSLLTEADEIEPLERLRFFCSLAMTGQDWLDVEPFFDAVAASQASPDSERLDALDWITEAAQSVIAIYDREGDWYTYIGGEMDDLRAAIDAARKEQPR